MTLLWSLFKHTLSCFIRRPVAYTLVQWPMVVLLFVGEAITPDQINRMTDLAVPLLIYLPLMVAGMAISSAGTWLIHQGSDPQSALPKAVSLLPQLFLPGLYATIWILVGLPILLPGIYFSALFLFVPYLVLTEPGGKAFSYLHRSKGLAQKRLGVSLALATGILLLDLASLGIQEVLSTTVAASTGLPLVGYSLEGGFAAILAANVSIGVILYFHRMREAS